MLQTQAIRSLFGVVLAQLVRLSYGTTLTVSQDAGNATSPTMWGIMFEDINYSGDGGIHGQLLRNNGFQGDNPALTAYFSVGGTELAMDTSVALSDAIPRTLEVKTGTGSTGDVGFGNEGYWGIPVDGSVYSHSVFIRGSYQGPMTWTLSSNSTKEVFAKHTFDVDSSTNEFTEYTTWGQSTRTSLTDVVYELTFDASKAAGSSLWFGLPRLYPTTFHHRYNGLKPSLAEAIDNIGGTFLRFPGGNNLEGPNVENRWKWNETIGPLVSRPGHQGVWGYPNTDALGLHEYFEWCEDMSYEPFLDVYSGYSLDGTSVTGPALQPFVQEVLDELEYILGDKTTVMGAWRAQNGREDPWRLKWVEIGNEDDFACSTYPERFTVFYDAIHAKYPELQLISSAAGHQCLPNPFPEDLWIDYHEYNIPENYLSHFNIWDNVSRRNKYVVGEMARWGVRWSDMQGTVSEAVFMLGLERNSDLIQGVAFAPLISLIDHEQWAPNLIPFRQSPDGIVYTSSYWNQQLFAKNAGDMTRGVSSDSPLGPLYWSAVSSGNTYIVKVANSGPDSQPLTVNVAGKESGVLTVLGNDDPAAANTDTATPISPPVVSEIKGVDGSFSFTLPPWSIAVLRAD